MRRAVVMLLSVVLIVSFIGIIFAGVEYDGPMFGDGFSEGLGVMKLNEKEFSKNEKKSVFLRKSSK